MLGIFRRERPTAATVARDPAPTHVEWPGMEPMPISADPDWDAVHAWVERIEGDEARARAWDSCERAWMLHMRDSLGASFRLDESETARVVSTLDPRHAVYALEFMGRTLKRIQHTLKAVALMPDWGKDLLIVFDDDDAYYQYVSRFHPESGEFAFSSGMCIHRGCSHYVTTKSDLRTIEPVIAHEMTHGCVSHLPLPLWLNEGLAVNTEQRITGVPPPLFTPQEMHLKHRKFWRASEIQEFWSGKSFRRPDEGNMLSYDLARIMVDQLSADWPRFAAFANAASYEDGGAAAAQEHLGLNLGAVAAALVERKNPSGFAPDPASWKDAEHVPE